MDDNQKQDLVIKDAQYRKGLSIAFFNATNAAIAMTATMKFNSSKESLEKIIEIRDFFLSEHADYYGRVIAKVGNHFDPKTTLARLQDAKSKSELKIVWLSLSEDERQNEEIKKLAYSLREQFVKAEAEA
jgi:hypothetical protein